jgi:hypothetical protein
MTTKAPWLKEGEEAKELPLHKTDGRIKERPWSTPEEFDAYVDQYFQACYETFANKEVPTEAPCFPGLYLHLGVIDRSGMMDYLASSAGQAYDLNYRRAYAMIEKYLVVNAQITSNPAGSIFLLKNMGYSDKQDVHVTGKVEKVVREIVRPDDTDS